MKGYILSSHPVWCVLYDLGLPHEIVNIIFSYKTFFSPLNQTFFEFTDTMNSFTFMKQKNINIHNNLQNIFMTFIFKNNNIHSRDLLYRFVTKHLNIYMKPEQYILEQFLHFHDKTNENRSLLDKTLVKLKVKSREFAKATPKHIIDLTGKTLKSILTVRFIYNIKKIMSRNFAIRKIDYYSYYKNKYNITFVFKNIMFILLNFARKRINSWCPDAFNIKIPKSELILFNLMAGLPFKKSWTKIQLINNLMKKEIQNTDSLVAIYKKNPIYNMENLNEMLDKVHISSINNQDGTIDFNRTIEKLHFEYDEYCYKLQYESVAAMDIHV